MFVVCMFIQSRGVNKGMNNFFGNMSFYLPKKAGVSILKNIMSIFKIWTHVGIIYL